MVRVGGDRRGDQLNMGVIMADDPTDGLGAAVAGAIAAAGSARLPLVDVEELDLFQARGGVSAKADAGLALDEIRRRGRPRGSSNKRTAKWRDYLLSRYAHPLEVMAQTITRAPAELAAELGCTVLEAFQVQQRAAAELAPYLESKMPTLAHVALDSGVTVLMPGFNAPHGSTMAELEAMVDDFDGITLDVMDGAKVIDG